MAAGAENTTATLRRRCTLCSEGLGGQSIGRHGRSTDHRPDLPEMVVGGRMRRTDEAGEVARKSRKPWREVTPERRSAKDPAPLKVGEGEWLKRELELRMERKGIQAEWGEVVRGLDNLQQVELLLQGSRFLLRGEINGHAAGAIRTAEVAMPPVLREPA